MSNILLIRFTCILVLVLCPQSVRADKLSDWQVICSELDAARKLSLSTSWDAPQMRAAYQKSVMDIEAYQAAYPRDGAGLHNETNLFRAYLEILAWEQATVPTPDDPHGMRNVISRVQALYQKGKAAETAGNWQEARENYSVCCGYWGSIRQLHPQWRPEFVAEQQHLCLDSFIAVDGKIRLKNNHYIDPQLHTQLSV